MYMSVIFPGSSCPQAVHCCLDGLHGKDFIDEDKALDAFDRLALNKVCIAQVMENSGARVSVELIDSESDGQQTINSLLLQDLCSQAKLTPVLPEVFMYMYMCVYIVYMYIHTHTL